MRRNQTFKGGRGGRKGAAGRSNNNNNQQQQQTIPDEWHSSASPSCQRLTRIVQQDLGFGRADAADAAVAEKSDDSQAPPPPSPPAAALSGWPALVRDYLLWGNPQQSSATVASTAKKKKKKKKKKSKKVATNEGEGAAQSQDEDEVAEASSIAATSTTVSTTEELAPSPAAAPPPATETPPAIVASDAAESLAAAPAAASTKAPPEESSSSPPTPPTWHSQRLERRRAWVERFLQQYRQEADPPMDIQEINKKMDKFLSWLSATHSSATSADGSSNGKEQQSQGDDASTSLPPPTALIPFASAEQMKQLAQAIECHDCRHQVSRFLENAIVLSGTQEVVDDVAVSFQYQAMEEGNGKALPPFTLTLVPPDPHSQQLPASSPSAMWRIQRNDGSSVVWTRQVLDFWLHEYILLGGLGYDRVVVGPTGLHMEDDQYHLLRDRLPQTARDLMDESNQWAQSLEREGGNLYGIRLNIEDPIDMKSPPILFDVDTALTAILDRILRSVLKITQAYQRVGVYHRRASQKTNVPVMSSRLLANDKAMISLWSVLLTSILEILQHLSGLENKLVSLADSQGQIPHLFYNGHARKAFEAYVQGKFKTIAALISNMTDAIDNGDDVETVSTVFNTSLARSVYATDDLLQIVVPHHNALLRSSVLEEACEDILYMIRDWSEYYRQTMLEKIIEEHENRRRRIAEAFDRADQIFQMTKKDIVTDSLEIKSIEGWYEKWKRRDLDSLPVTDTSSLRKVRETVLEKTLAMMHLLLRIGKYRPVNPTTYPEQLVSMPLHLIEWAATGRVPDPEHAVCSYGAQSRAGCLASSVMFDWMSQKYSEWQAEVAGQELLVDLTANDTAGGSTWSQVARGVKKQPSKKKATPAAKATPAPASNGNAQTDSATGAHDEDSSDDDAFWLASMAKGKAAPAGTTPPEPTKNAAVASLETTPVTTATAELDEKNVDILGTVEPKSEVHENGSKEATTITVESSEAISNQFEPAETSPVGHAADSTEKVAQQPESNHQEMDQSTESAAPISSVELDAMIDVGVVDRSGYQTAQEFLLSRFIGITKTKGSKVKVVEIL